MLPREPARKSLWMGSSRSWCYYTVNSAGTLQKLSMNRRQVCVRIALSRVTFHSHTSDTFKPEPLKK